MLDRWATIGQRLIVALVLPVLGGSLGSSAALGDDRPPPASPAPPPAPTLESRLNEARAAWSKLDEAVAECQAIREAANRIKALTYQRQHAAAQVASCRALEDRLWPGRNRNNETMVQYRAVLDQRTSLAAEVAEMDSQLIDLRLRDTSPAQTRAVETQIRERTDVLATHLKDLRQAIQEAKTRPDRPDATLVAAQRFLARTDRYLKALKR